MSTSHDKERIVQLVSTDLRDLTLRAADRGLCCTCVLTLAAVMLVDAMRALMTDREFAVVLDALQEAAALTEPERPTDVAKQRLH